MPIVRRNGGKRRQAFGAECMLQEAWTRHSARESLMSMTSIGGDASQRWQILKESRANPSAGAATSAVDRPRSQRGSPPAALGSAAGLAGAGEISSASAKVITDLKALFISLQSAASGDPSGSAAAGGAGATAAPGPASVQSGLKSLFTDLAKVGGHHPHPPSADPSSTDLTAAAGQPTPTPSGNLLDDIFGALKAYAAPSTGNSAKAGIALSA